MRLKRKNRLYLLGDSENFDNIYYVENGVVKKQPFAAFDNTTNSPFLLRNPIGWKDEEISLATSDKYKCLIRSFNLSAEFVYEGAEIIRYQQYTGRGFEEVMYMAILKWNRDNDIYYLEYKGKLDLATTEDGIKNKSVKLNSVEGGALTYLNANDSVDYGVVCDETNPDAKQLYLDGMNLREALNYSFLDIELDGYEAMTPLAFLNNEGDHEGVLFGNPIYERLISYDFVASTNYVFKNVSANNIVLKFEGVLRFNSITLGAGGTSSTFKLHTRISSETEAFPFVEQISLHVPVGAISVPFSFEITLLPSEKIFIWHELTAIPEVQAASSINFARSDFKISFTSKKEPTYSFCLSIYDYVKQLWAKVCEGKYPFVSNYLQSRTDLVITCGDALRNSDRSVISNYVINGSFDDAFQSIPPDVNVGSGIALQIKNNTLYIERLSDFISDESSIFDLGQVSDFKIKVATDVIHNTISAGYPDQQYESNSGKYEFNSEQIWKLPILSVKRELNLRSVWRADSRGIELIRAKFTHLDTTDNSGDKEPFLIQISDQVLNEFFNAQLSTPTDYTGGNFITFNGAISGNHIVTENRILFTFNSNYQRANVNAYLYVDNGGHTVQAILFKNGQSVSIYVGNDTNAVSAIRLSYVDNNIKLNDNWEIKIIPFDVGFQDYTVVAASLYFEFLNKPLLLLRDEFDVIGGTLDETVFNLGLRPKNQIRGHGNEIHGICAQLNSEQIVLTSHSKNVELFTTKDAVTLYEKSPINISELADPLWLPYDFEFTTQVPYYFTDLLAMSTAGYFSFIANGIQFYALPIGEMKSSPANGGAQQWTLRAAARNLFLDFYKVGNDISTNFNFSNNMVATSIYCPLHLTRYGFTPQAKYHHIEMHEDWSYHRYQNWFVNGKNAFYTQKWQLADTIKIPLITSGLGQLSLFVYDEYGNLYNSGLFTILPAPSVRLPFTLQEYDLTFLDEGRYLVVVKAGSQNVFISEWQELREDWPDTMLFNYSHSENELNVPWLSFNGYLSFRCEALFEQLEPLTEAIDYEDDGGDFSILNGKALMKRNLIIGTTRKVPEWVGLKMNAILLKDKVYAEGEPGDLTKHYTRRAASQMEVKKYEGLPFLSYVIEIIPAENQMFTQIENVPIDDVYGWHATITAQVFGNDTGSSEITILNE